MRVNDFWPNVSWITPLFLVAALAGYAHATGNMELSLPMQKVSHVQNQDKGGLEIFADKLHTRKLLPELNKLLEGMEIPLPDFSRSVSLGFFGDATITGENLICDGFSVQDLRISNNRINDKQISFSLEVIGLDFDCVMDWTFDTIIGGDNGNATLETDDNSLALEFTFESENFNDKPPISTVLSDCDATIQISVFEVNGGNLLGDFLDVIGGVFTDGIEGVANEGLCEAAGSLETALLNITETFDEILKPFQGTVPPELENPLYPEIHLPVSSDVKLINFQSEDGAVRMIFDSINTFLGGIVDDPSVPGGQDLAINQMMRSLLLNADRALVIDGLPNADVLSESGISLSQIRIYGLDTMTEFKLDTLGKHTLSSSFDWEFMTLEIDLDVTMNTNEPDGQTSVVTEAVQLKFGLRDIDMDFALMLAIDGQNITTIPVGSLLDLDRLMPCLIDSTIYGIEISGMSIQVADIDAPTIDGFICSGLDDLVSSLIQAFFEMYEGHFISLLPFIFQVEVRGMLNDYIDKAVIGPSDCSFDGGSTIMNLPDLLLPAEEALLVGGSGTAPYGSTFPLLVSTLMNELTKIDEKGFSAINDILIRQLTPEGTWLFGDLADVDASISFGSFSLNFKLKIYDTMIENLDSVGEPIELLNAVAPAVLNNTATLGVSDHPFTFSTNLLLAIGAEEINTNIYNDIKLSVEFNDMVMNLAVFMSVVKDTLMNMPLKDMTNIDCLAAMISTPVLDSNGIRVGEPTMSMENLSLLASQITLKMDCVQCSPGILQLVQLLTAAASFVDFTENINALVNSVAGLIEGDGVQVMIDRYLVSASQTCPSSDKYSSSPAVVDYGNASFSTLPADSNNFIRIFAILLAILLLLCGIFAVSARRSKKQIVSNWMPNASPEEIQKLKTKDAYSERLKDVLNSRTSAMITSASIPCFVRILIPLVILGNIGLFLSGHLSLGARVDINFDLVGDAVSLENVFQFSLGGSIRDMWDSGAKELAVIVTIFSGIWPYTKQCITMFLWFAPVQRVSVQKRESVLLWLDALGKWSFVDIFVLIMTLIGFRVALTAPESLVILTEPLYSFDLIVVPCWGLFANMLAQIISQLSSHVVIHYHRKIVFDCLQNGNNDDSSSNRSDIDKRALNNHSFSIIGNKEANVKKGANTVIILSTLAIVALFLCGLILPIFSIEAFGVVGVAIEAGENAESALVNHNFLSIIKVIAEHAEYTSNYIGLGALFTVFIITVGVVPILQTLLLLVRWLVPMTRKTRHRIAVVIEILMAWQYSEVFIISVIITAWQIGTVSDFLINDYCGMLDETFATMVSLGILDEIDGQCFRVHAVAKTGSWFLISAAVLLAIQNHFVRMAAKQQTEELEVTANMSQYTDVESKINSAHEFSPRSSVDFTDYYRLALNISYVHMDLPKEDSPQSNATETPLKLIPAKRNADNENFDDP